MKKVIFGLAIVMSFVFAGCAGKDAEINAFISDSDKLANDIVKKVKDNPTVAGIDEAQKLLDSKKADLKTKYDVVKTARGYQVKEETMKKFTDSVFKNSESVNGLKLDYVEKTVEDESFGKKIDKLVEDFNAIYEV